ncbi:MAG: LapA family protein [Spirulina sp. SIO3F2]|nr:LapA family protein [Spirulina sp. SIO3F2]
MRQLNFVLIFVVCLAIALFCLQNTDPVMIQLIPGYQVESPLAVELLITLGIGAVLAWMFSLWTQLQQQLSAFQDYQLVKSRDRRIKDLEKEVKNYQDKLEKQQVLPPAEG